MDKIRNLLEELYELGIEDGVTLHQFESCESDEFGESWFETIKEFAKRHDVEIKNYDDWDIWDKATDLNHIVKEKIIENIIKELDNKNFRAIAIDILDNIYNDDDGILIEEAIKEIRYFVGSLDEAKVIEEFLKLCEEEGINVYM